MHHPKVVERWEEFPAEGEDVRVIHGGSLAVVAAQGVVDGHPAG
jgi:hypothetical protein